MQCGPAWSTSSTIFLPTQTTEADLRTAHEAIFVATADAATDGEHPGLGGFLHGMWWHMPLTEAAAQRLHITVLELLATGLNAVIFHLHLRGAGRIVLLSDALATPYTLARQRAKSHMLVYAHRRLLASEAFVEVADRAEIAHLSGDCNPLSDSASRFKIDELQEVAEEIDMCITSHPLPPPPTAPPSAAEMAAAAAAVPSSSGGHFKSSKSAR